MSDFDMFLAILAVCGVRCEWGTRLGDGAPVLIARGKGVRAVVDVNDMGREPVVIGSEG